MRNEKLKREIDQNLKRNEVFVRQSASDLAKTVLYIRKNYQEDLCLQLSSFIWNQYANLFKNYPDHHVLIWKQYIVFQLLEFFKLQQGKFEQDVFEKCVFQTFQENEFFMKEQLILKELQQNLSSKIRLHFVMDGLKDESACKAASFYLREEIPQSVMIYTHSDSYLEKTQSKNRYWHHYDYLVFDEYQEGVPSQYRKMKQKGSF